MWYNPATWSWVDNLQGQNEQPKTSNQQYYGSLYYDPATGQVMQNTSGDTWQPIADASGGVVEGMTTYNPSGGGGGGGAGADPTDTERTALRGRITSRGSEIDAAYRALFSQLEELIKTRDAELEQQYGGQVTKAANQLTEALPVIDASFASLGSYDSTQRGDSRGKAQTGFNETVKTIGKNKETDKAKLGQYKTEQSARISADEQAAKRAIESSGTTTDVNALRGLADNLDQNLSQTGITKATLMSDGTAAKALADSTGDNGRFQEAINALDSIIKSSMPTDVKQAAVKAVTDAGGLTDEEKKKVEAQYGNVYAEQATL